MVLICFCSLKAEVRYTILSSILRASIHCKFQEVKNNPHNYDAWFDYLRLVEKEGEADQVREIYERAIANVPPSRVSDYIHFSFGMLIHREP